MSTPRKRVLFMIPTLTGGGAERVMITILRHLDRARFIPALAVVDTRNAAFLNDVPEDVAFIDLRCTRVRYALPKLIRLIRSRRPDVVLSTLRQLNLALAILRPLLPNGVRYVARETTVLSEALKRKKWPGLWNWAYGRFYSRFDLVICQSHGMQKDLVNHFGVPPMKTVVIYNPLDLERIHQLAGRTTDRAVKQSGHADTNRPLRLVSAGRLSYEKGFDLLIDALALCKRKRVQLTLLGEGPLRKDLEQQAIARGVAHQVTFAGFQENPYPFLAQADAFVLSSRVEGFPNVVLEALACGTPVISLPAIGGVQEILEGLPGCVIAEHVTAESLADAIERYSCGVSVDHTAVECYAAQEITKLYEEQLMTDILR